MAEEEVKEIEEQEGAAAPLLPNSVGGESGASRSDGTVKTAVPEADVHVYKQGKGPIDVVKMALGGWNQNQLDIGEILHKYGFKSVWAFVPGSGRGVPIRFSQKNGRSLLTYRDGSVVYLDGEPKDSMVQPITKIIVGVAVITLMIMFVVKETPEWAKKLNLSNTGIPPWLLACVVIVFTRLRKRTRKFLEGNTQ